MTEVKKMKLGSQGLEVSVQGLGCAGLARTPKPEDEVIALIHHAINSGITFLDTADIYGPFISEILVGKALKGGMREKVQLATKFGIKMVDGKMGVQGDPTYVRAACEASLKRLDVDYIDLYYQHRVDTHVPIEVTTRDLEDEIVPTCRELGIGIVAYSPLGRGFFSLGPKIVKNFYEGDYRKNIPRFRPENLELNKHIFERVSEMAARKGCTATQLALAWVHHRGDDVCPIPGTSKINNLNQNIAALSVKLTPDEMAELESFASADNVKSDRIWTTTYTWQDSDTPPLSSSQT